jgi:hypothetical protein
MNKENTIISCFHSYNYTFNSMGSIGTILLLNLIVSYKLDQFLAYGFHFGSLIGIIIINKEYYKNFNNIHEKN